MNEEKNKKLVGRIINLISSDAQNVIMFFKFLYFFVLYPLLIAACICMIVTKLEPQALWATPLVALFFLVNGTLERLNVKFK